MPLRVVTLAAIVIGFTVMDLAARLLPPDAAFPFVFVGLTVILWAVGIGLFVTIFGEDQEGD